MNIMSKRIKTERKVIKNANVLAVEAGTNTPMGGDAGHGGITVFKLSDYGATAWKLVYIKDTDQTVVEQPDKITIALYGDTEAETFMEALRFALQTLGIQHSEIPVIKALPRPDFKEGLMFWCPFCKEWHRHGKGKGHRHAHCTNPDSPYNITGYILEPISKKKLQKIKHE